MTYVIIIKHANVIMIKHAMSYSLIESQLLPCAPACSYRFHAFALYLQATFTAPF